MKQAGCFLGKAKKNKSRIMIKAMYLKTFLPVIEAETDEM
jgi:hypothetical protein